MRSHYERQLHELDMIAFATEQTLDAFVQENAELSKRCLDVIGRFVSTAYRKYVESDSWPRLSGGRNLQREFVDALPQLTACEGNVHGSPGFLATRNEEDRARYGAYSLHFRGWPEMGEYRQLPDGHPFFGFPAVPPDRAVSVVLGDSLESLRQLRHILFVWIPSRQLIAATIAFNLRDALAHQQWEFNRLTETWMQFLVAMDMTYRKGQH